MTLEELEDALDDLAHDLGKYIHLPISLLPTDATEDVVRAAAFTALLATRRGPGGTQSAQSIWEDFRTEVGNALTELDGWSELEHAVGRALVWANELDEAEGTLDRTALMTDLKAVAPAIRKLRNQVNG